MLSQLSGAVLRMILVMVLVALPAVFLVDVGPDTKQMVALIALFAGSLTFIEYNAKYPSLIEFRDAAPFNRVRFGMLFAIVFCLSTIESGRMNPTTLSRFIEAVGTLVGLALDFSFSPVRLATLMVGPDASLELIHAIRAVVVRHGGVDLERPPRRPQRPIELGSQVESPQNCQRAPLE